MLKLPLQINFTFFYNRQADDDLLVVGIVDGLVG